MDALLKIVHVLAAVVWVGGMVFAHFFLRPSLEAAGLEPPLRLQLMREVLRRFFAAVGAAVALLLVSGAWMIERAATMVAATGGQLVMPWSWSLMTGLGLVMAVTFAFIRLRLFVSLQQALDAGERPAAAVALARIRTWVGVNLLLGTVVIALAVARV